MYNHYHIQLFYWLSPHSTSLLYYSPLFTTLRHSTLQYNITFIHNLPHSAILSCSVTLLHLAALTHSPSMSHFSVLLHCELRALPQLQHTTTPQRTTYIPAYFTPHLVTTHISPFYQRTGITRSDFSWSRCVTRNRQYSRLWSLAKTWFLKRRVGPPISPCLYHNFNVSLRRINAYTFNSI